MNEKIKETSLRQIFPKDYPIELRETPEPPPMLWIEGVMPPPDFKRLAVVGARKYSHYGREACETLIAGLAGFPVAIVSGLALGIDSIAHEAALRAGLPTIAIPGSGLDPDFIYPRQHWQLAEAIVKAGTEPQWDGSESLGGCLLSEHEPRTQARPYFFPQRNRIMAGLCHAVLIVEAERKSGTMITARLAADYNRDVLAVPGSIFSPQSDGPNYLIRLGATPVLESRDILHLLGIDVDGSAGVADPENEGKAGTAESKASSLFYSLFDTEGGSKNNL